jgi:hypothetical protein
MRRMRMAGKLMAADPDWSYPGHFRPQPKPAAALRHCLHAGRHQSNIEDNLP